MCRKRGSQNSQNSRSIRESSEDIFLSQDLPGPSSQTNRSSQRCTRNSNLRESQFMSSQDMETQKKMQLISNVIRYLFVADRTKHPIQKTQIVKNVLGGNGKIFRQIIESVIRELSEVFGYKLIEVESNKYILMNEIENKLPHLIFQHNYKQVLLYLILVHIFMYGESCKEEILWNFLENLGIISDNNFQHKYFGDVEHLVTVEFVNQRYLEKIITNKNDPTQFEYAWGSRARNEFTYRSALQFVADIYGCSIKKWKLQYNAMIEDEQENE
ncbi:non-structural maintenance of chromosomes element 3 homolog isoform X3 [Pogonomyrmex barbatus]|uniref:Non-structural maintenance of chromosomes element 3 homolog isoform X3 n=1 Tax=Pogonomyrmex barbatus TaxID=144034 RepID=A0A6I9VXX0_9HYME|nr:non-structural maintenance of chromosomes element 3 homolog isoform X3 [Pogonomyrmex barbatus]